MCNVAGITGPGAMPITALPPATTNAPITGGGSFPSLETAIAALTTAVQGLAQSLSGAGIVTGGGALGAIPTAAAAAAPTQLAPAQSMSAQSTQAQASSRSKRRLGARAAQDGPGVVRSVVDKATLEQDPRLRGKLEPPSGGAPPKGVKVRTRADGTRAVTINIHGAAPAGKGITPGNESIQGLRDIAAYVNSIDPDVVMVQEINDRQSKVGDPGLSPVTSVMAHLIGATDMAYTPGAGGSGSRRGTAIFTRNGFTIEQAHNVDIPDRGDPARRSAGVAVVQPPDGRPAFSVISTHMSHMANMAASQRRHDQLAELDRIAGAIRTGGEFSYRSPGGGQSRAAGFPQDHILLGGDLNTTQGGRNGKLDSADAQLASSGLRHANDLYGRGNVRPRIDHIYAYGFGATSSALQGVAANELQSGSPTDHPGYVTDLSF